MKPTAHDSEDIETWNLGAAAMLVGEKGVTRQRYAYLLAAAALRAAGDPSMADQMQVKGLACKPAPAPITATRKRREWWDHK